MTFSVILNDSDLTHLSFVFKLQSKWGVCMLFSDKLNFLLKLTDTSNKQLSFVLSCDPSLISRMRNGRRKPPQSSEQIMTLANYFAKKCSSDYQRAALAETIGQSRIKLIIKSGVLASILADWLGNRETTGNIQTEQVIHTVNISLSPSGSDADAHTESISGTKAFDKYQSYAYFGNCGKRAAIRRLLTHLLELPNPCCIYIACDEDSSWLTESPSFAAEVQGCIIKLCNKGFALRRIAPITNNTSDAVDSFVRWMPVYVHGKIQSFYYPRTRDNVFHRTLVVAPGVAALTADSVGYRIDGGMCLLHFDPQIVTAEAQYFEDYLAKCLPLTRTHFHDDGGESVLDCLLRYSKLGANCSIKYAGLPSSLTPTSIIHQIFKGYSEEEASFLQISSNYLKSMEKYNKLEIITLAAIEDIVSGKVLCAPSLLSPNNQPYYYSVNEYINHLHKVLNMIETYPDYTVVVSDEAPTENALIVAEGLLCCIFRYATPVMVFEISEQNTVAASGDYIRHSAKFSPGKKIRLSNEAAIRIKDLIAQLKELHRC